MLETNIVQVKREESVSVSIFNKEVADGLRVPAAATSCSFVRIVSNEGP